MLDPKGGIHTQPTAMNRFSSRGKVTACIQTKPTRRSLPPRPPQRSHSVTECATVKYRDDRLGSSFTYPRLAHASGTCTCLLRAPARPQMRNVAFVRAYVSGTCPVRARAQQSYPIAITLTAYAILA
ncbi:hypothetical protein EVAR_33651_1 [Eumeta japonica]|uniref:Uncharacterized protein n=1 Tax=Eumeta variegata TaxID=151549 RepID=A0A4C1VLT7_EUMVA|nr:hypothetical protein EVAR_33651_1 [Eumeta japonica]